MKKWYIIVITVQTVLIVMFLVYALVQREQAIKQREFAVEAQGRAEENEKRALESQMIAQQQMSIAEQNAHAAQVARVQADELLKACKERQGKK